MTEIFLHIGTHKTGTTAIQNFCSKNFTSLKEQGILYPHVHTKWGGHHQLPWHLGVSHPHKTVSLTFEKIVADIHEHIAEEQPRKVIISSEDLEFLTLPAIKKLREAFQEYSIKILVYFRRQDNYLVSEYKQHVRMEVTQFPGTLFDFLLRYDFEPRFNYRHITEKWSSVFGEDAIVVRPFERQQLKDGDVVADFVELLKIERLNAMQAVEDKESNIGLSNIATVILSKLNAHQLHNRRQLIELLSQLDVPDIELLSNSSRQQLLERFKLSNSYVAEKYLKRADGQLYYDEIKSTSSTNNNLEKHVIEALINLVVIDPSQIVSIS